MLVRPVTTAAAPSLSPCWARIALIQARISASSSAPTTCSVEPSLMEKKLLAPPGTAETSPTSAPVRAGSRCSEREVATIASRRSTTPTRNSLSRCADQTKSVPRSSNQRRAKLAKPEDVAG